MLCFALLCCYPNAAAAQAIFISHPPPFPYLIQLHFIARPPFTLLSPTSMPTPPKQHHTRLTSLLPHHCCHELPPSRDTPSSPCRSPGPPQPSCHALASPGILKYPSTPPRCIERVSIVLHPTYTLHAVVDFISFDLCYTNLPYRTAATFSPRRNSTLTATAAAALLSPALTVWCISLAFSTDLIPYVTQNCPGSQSSRRLIAPDSV